MSAVTPNIPSPPAVAFNTFKQHPVPCYQTMEAVIRADLAQLHQAGQAGKAGILCLLSSARWTAAVLDKGDQAAAQAVAAAEGAVANQLFSLLCSTLKGLSAACSAANSVCKLKFSVSALFGVMCTAGRGAESPLWLLVLARCCSVLGRIVAKLCEEERLVPADTQQQGAHPAGVLLGPAKALLAVARSCLDFIGKKLTAVQLPGEGAAAAAAMQALQEQRAALSRLLRQHFDKPEQQAGSAHATRGSSRSSSSRCCYGGSGSSRVADFQQEVQDAVGLQLALQLQQLGDAISTQLPTDLACNNPGCCNGARPSEQDLVRGGSQCSGCRSAR